MSSIQLCCATGITRFVDDDCFPHSNWNRPELFIRGENINGFQVARKEIHEPRCKEQARLQVQVYDSAKGLDAELIIESTQLLHIF
jgi:hypothetical protein